MTQAGSVGQRRNRRARPPLSRESIIATTIALMRRDGLKKATLRQVAVALDTGPASLYVYVQNTAELYAAVLDELLGGLDLGGAGSWKQRLVRIVTDYRTLLVSHPGLARAALAVRPSGRNTLALFDRLGSLLVQGGVDAYRASWGVDSLLLFATATAAEHAPPEEGEVASTSDAEDQMNAVSRAIRNADPVTNPFLAAHAEALLSGTPEQRWSWALRAQLAGIAYSPKPPPR